MDATQFFVQQKTRKFEADCHSAQAQVLRMTSIPDVVRVARVTADPVIRGMTRSMPCFRALTAATERRLKELIEEQISTVRKEEDLEQRRQILGRLRVSEWDTLRGDYAMQWRIADREAQLLLARR